MKLVLTIQAIIVALWDDECIVLGDTYETRYNREHPEAPPSPFRINIRTAPDGPLTREFVFEIGRHMAETLLQTKTRPQFQGIFGIPNAGNILMEGFLRQWPANLYPLILEKVEDGSGRRFNIADTDGLQYHRGYEFWGVDDLVTSLYTKEMVMSAIPNRVVGISVLIDRSANAEERLAEKGIMLSSSATTASMLTILVSAGRLTSDQAIAIAKADQAFCQYMADHP